MLHSSVEQARQQGTAIALDVNWRPIFWDPAADPAAGPDPEALAAIRPLLEQAELIKLAREESLWCFATDDPAAVRAALPQRPDVVDTTDAGDAFTAGLLHRWDSAPSERIRFAAACGALVCGGAGGIDPQQDEAQIDAFLGAMS